ncbi:MAG: DUF1330 domain-containing protein [Pseudomonadota bacterium]
MVHIESDADRLRHMRTKNPDEPIVMLNMLRYRDTAAQGAGVDGLSGRAAYEAYGRRFAKLQPRFGGTPIWMGRADTTLIGAEGWDVIILVHYPSRRQFLDMLEDADYQAIAPIRSAALADSRLIETHQLLANPMPA